MDTIPSPASVLLSPPRAALVPSREGTRAGLCCTATQCSGTRAGSVLCRGSEVLTLSPFQVKHKLLSNSPHGSIVANLRGDIQHLKHQLYATPGPGKHRAIRYTQGMPGPTVLPRSCRARC